MRSLIFLLTTTALIGAAACSQAEPSAEYKTEAEVAAPAVPATESVAASAATQDALPQLTGSYWEARKVLLAQGYTSANETTEGRRVCIAEMEQEREISGACPSAEEVLPEVEDCAGTGMGQCLTLWRSPGGRVVRIVTVDGPQPGVISTIEWAQN
ncbi:hypothetical protein [Brevundimonas sp.]